MVNRKLTQKQIAVLAAVRDDDVRRVIKWNPFACGGCYVRHYEAHGFDVSLQIQALKRRKMISGNGLYMPVRHWSGPIVHYGLTDLGEAELAIHPEF